MKANAERARASELLAKAAVSVPRLLVEKFKHACASQKSDRVVCFWGLILGRLETKKKSKKAQVVATDILIPFQADNSAGGFPESVRLKEKETACYSDSDDPRSRVGLMCWCPRDEDGWKEHARSLVLSIFEMGCCTLPESGFVILVNSSIDSEIIYTFESVEGWKQTGAVVYVESGKRALCKLWCDEDAQSMDSLEARVDRLAKTAPVGDATE